MGENNNLALNAKIGTFFALIIIIVSTFTFVGYANQQDGIEEHLPVPSEQLTFTQISNDKLAISDGNESSFARFMKSIQQLDTLFPQPTHNK